MPDDATTKRPDGDRAAEETALRLLRRTPIARPCTQCGGEVHIRPAHLGLKDHLMIVGILSTAGWISLGLGQILPKAGVVLGVFCACVVGGSVLERRFLFQEHRCQGCGRRRLRPREWVNARFGPRISLISLLACSVGIALLITVIRFLATA